MTATKTRITRAICWLPADEGWHEGEYTRRDGAWSWTEKTWRIIGRIGYQVTVEVFPVQPGPSTSPHQETA